MSIIKQIDEKESSNYLELQVEHYNYFIDTDTVDYHALKKIMLGEEYSVNIDNIKVVFTWEDTLQIRIETELPNNNVSAWMSKNETRILSELNKYIRLYKLKNTLSSATEKE